MKIYILYGLHYDFCNEWDCIIGIYDSEDKAVMAQILEEEQIKYKANPEQYYTRIEQAMLL